MGRTALSSVAVCFGIFKGVSASSSGMELTTVLRRVLSIPAGSLFSPSPPVMMLWKERPEERLFVCALSRSLHFGYHIGA
ncbi:uncharacterized protein BT62DRAFT_1009419 [Guyanagaster necrorhizus]|uniref:Secreted protein n=1 Tax=Guyanagaster necrorhizus TaxID=856835 RepID=A0A9P7VML8_9AGAR|nr:uncharacterized protein BT62DRAFT_1009419 [Guyanagaster necrorhizus MCA 3950]KAG7443232.1 hypothetical protein BT62DRAFT_1009419 [Guyanagaster necrorhizus MCA 3950]